MAHQDNDHPPYGIRDTLIVEVLQSGSGTPQLNVRQWAVSKENFQCYPRAREKGRLQDASKKEI